MGGFNGSLQCLVPQLHPVNLCWKLSGPQTSWEPSAKNHAENEVNNEGQEGQEVKKTISVKVYN
ncbi:hypothetical protein D4764_01G0007920 [Takifugu flavidus]|uniref:Uncharacterized protein n=1 Tax=Takifugu flavidus TaxID=433684 RepID=A0A5C6PRI4_9TELE|nr:hypothetical protein D4764_01G0007920 [Takifugu flavidus]